MSLACESGKEIKRIREEFERDVLKPIKAAFAGISTPPGWRDIWKLLAAVTTMSGKLPRAEQLGRELRVVETMLRGDCVVEPSPPEPPPVEPPTEPPVEPPIEPPPNLLRGAIIASNSAQDIAAFPETSRITSVEISEQLICIEHTGRWTEWLSKSAGDGPGGEGVLIEGSVWIFAEIDGVLHGGTYESKRPNQRCKALTPKVYGGTVATRLAGHIKQRPLANWVPRAGERVWFLESTPARNRDERIYPGEQGRSDLFEVVWPG